MMPIKQNINPRILVSDIPSLKIKTPAIKRIPKAKDEENTEVKDNFHPLLYANK